MSRRLPPLTALRAFEAAARLGSFQRAAEELHVTAGAISQQVKALETTMSVTLFHRRARSLVLSEAGKAYLPAISQAFDQVAQATRHCQAGLLTGRLKISVLPSFASGWLIRRLPDFRGRYPEIELVIDADLHFVDLARSDIDLAIRYSRGDFTGLQARLLMPEDIFPVCAPQLLNAGRPLRQFDDLRHHTLLHALTPVSNEPWVKWQPWLQEAGLTTEGWPAGISFTDSSHLIQAAIQGQGIALGRSALIGDQLAQGQLVRPFAVTRRATHAFHLVWLGDTAPPAKTAAFIDWCLDQVAVSSPATAETPAVAGGLGLTM
jgi:LysR family glycine cleavage system transcriptional activator